MRPAALTTLALGAFACTGSDPPPPPVTMPPGEVFGRLLQRAPVSQVELPLLLDTKSCAFGRYELDTPEPRPFVLIHPIRARCELWLGHTGFVFEYCSFPRKELVEIDGSLRFLFRIVDDEHCTFGADPPDNSAPLQGGAQVQVPESANARAATQAFASNRDQLD